jgi:photosystem II stability/assembly factor-like uncharacterized protein
VTCIAVSPVNPDHMALGSGANYHTARVHVSRDGGRTWAIPDLPFPWPEVTGINDVEFGPDGRLYVAAYRTLLRSDANLHTWESLPVAAGNPDIQFIYFQEVSINPGNPGEIWAGTQQSFQFKAPAPRLMRSTDDGQHWTDITPPIEDSGAFSGIAFNRAATNRVVVVSNGFANGPIGEVWRTLDGGVTWLKGTGYAGLLNDVVHDGLRFFICGGFDGTVAEQNIGVFRSTDDGLTWSSQHTPLWPSRHVHDLAVEPTQPGTVFAATTRGIFRCSGNDWTFDVGPADYHPYAIACVPGHPGRLFVGTENFGVLRRDGEGATFESSSKGIMLFNVNGAASNPARPEELAVCIQSWQSGGVLTSTDNGETWHRQPLPGLLFDSVEFAPNGTLYTIAGSGTRTTPEGIYRRNSDGTWTHLGPKHALNVFFNVVGMCVSPEDPSTIFAVGGDTPGFRPIVWRSTDGGTNWSTLPAGNVVSGAYQFTDIEIVDDGTGQNILVSNNGVGGLIASRDGGASWYRPAGVADDVTSYSVRGTPADLLTFYLGSGTPGLASNGRCHRTIDGGATWSPIGHTGPIEILEVDRADVNVLYGIRAHFAPLLVSRSIDGGNTFQPFDAGLDGGLAPRDIAWQEGGCPRLLLSTSAGLFVRSIDSVAPQISLELEPDILWPPDHKMKTITARLTTSDQCDTDPSIALSSIVVQDGAGASHDIVAGIGEGTTTFQLRAARPGEGERRYLVTYTATDAGGNTSQATATVVVPHDRRILKVSDDGATPGGDTPARTALVSIDPNPFNPATSATMTLAHAANVALDVYDVRGARVRTLASGILPAGTHRIAWDGTDHVGAPVASGVYFFRFVAGSLVQTMKALLIK